jgi:cyclohexanecarboxylate-CoA ligase
MARMRSLLSDDLVSRYDDQGLWQAHTLWDLAKRADPDRVAIVCPRHGSITYRQLTEEAERLAGVWQAHGISAGDPVILQIPNWYEAPLAHLALTRLGAITLPALPTYRAREITQLVEASGATAIVGATTFHHSPSEEFYRSVVAESETLRECWLVDDQAGGLRGVAAAGSSDGLSHPPDPDELTILIATSGTTGAQKLVAHSHRSTLGGVLGRIATDIIGLQEEDVILMASPVTHMTGLQYGIRMAAWLGATLVLMDRWNPADAAELVSTHGVTYTQGATPFLYDLVNLPGESREKLHTLRSFACGGAPIPPELAQRALEVMPGTALLPTWGLSETAIVTLVGPNDPPEKVTGSDGRAVPGWEVRIVSPEGDPVPPDVTGEIECRGAGLFHGYFGREDLTRSTLHDGWLRTGDRGRMDPHGYVRCLERIKDLIIRGGLNVSPSEIEALMRHHPNVEQVAVVGVPDERLGERICAVVIPRGEAPTVGEIGEFLLAKGLSKQKLPERIVAVDSFPVTAAGKVQKFVLREQVSELQAADAPHHS